MHQLELRLRHIAMDKELTPTARDRIVSCGESMSQIILSAYLSEVGKRAQQGFNVLKRNGVNGHDQVSNRACKVTNVSLVVYDSEGNQSVRVLYSASVEDGVVCKVDGEENECPIQVNSSVAASSSGMKRKADHVHPEAPPSVRQELADTTHPVPVDGDHVVRSRNDPYMDLMNDNAGGVSASFDADMTRIAEEYVQVPIRLGDAGDWARSRIGTGESGAEQLGLAQMVEGGSAPCRVLEETGHQDMTGLEGFALKNSTRRLLHSSGGDSTGLVAAEPELEDSSVPIEFDEAFLSSVFNFVNDE